MTREPLSVTGTLNDSSELVLQLAAPWAGFLFLTLVPLRFLQVNLIDRILMLRGDLHQYGNAVFEMSLLIGVAFLLATYGRAVFVRACRASLRARRAAGLEAFSLPAASAANLLYVSLLLQILFVSLFYTVLAIPLLTVLSGLAFATFELTRRPHLLAPLKEIARFANPVKVLVGILLVFTVALLITLVNLFAAFHAGLWLAGGISGADLTHWQAIFGLNRLFLLLVCAGATLAVEPFWLAANVVFVEKRRARQSGSDLKQWFQELGIDREDPGPLAEEKAG